MVGVRRKESCDGYRGQLRKNMVLWWLQGLPIETTKMAFVAIRLGIG